MSIKVEKSESARAKRPREGILVSTLNCERNGRKTRRSAKLKEGIIGTF